MNKQAIGADLEQFIRTDLLAGRRTTPIAPDEDLLSGGMLDSLSLFRLINFVGEQFQVEYQPADLTAENFCSINAIACYIVGEAARKVN